MSRPKKWQGEELEELRRLTERLTFGEIAGIYGLSTSAIQMACNRNGISGKQRNRDLRGAAALSADKPQRDPFGRARL